MKILVTPNDKHCFNHLIAGKILQVCLQTKDPVRLKVPTGNTIKDAYQLTAETIAKEGVDLSYVELYNYDEYCAFGSDEAEVEPLLFAAFMRENLFSHIPQDKRPHWYIPNAYAPDPVKEAQRYANLLRQAGRFRLSIAGIGTAESPTQGGHVAFIESGETLPLFCTAQRLNDNTRRVNDVPFSHAITMGVFDVCAADEVWVLANTASKQIPVAKGLLSGKVSTPWPISLLGLVHDKVTAVLTEDSFALVDVETLPEDYKVSYVSDPAEVGLDLNSILGQQKQGA